MKFRHALLALLAFGVGFAGLADQADAQGFGRRAGRQGKMNADGSRGVKMGFRGGQDAEGTGPFAALGLSEDQQAKLQELRETHRAQMEEFRAAGTRPSAEEIQQIREEHQAQFEAILTPEQLEQLEQFRANRPAGQPFRRQGRGLRGGAAGTGAGPFAALELTDAQMAEIQQIREEMRAQVQTFRESGTRPSADEIAQLREQTRARIEGILTDAQKAKLGELKGTTDAASKPTGAAVQSSSWGEVKEQMK